jgi:hypothetical protein
MDQVLTVVDGLTVLAVWAGLVWLWRKAKAHLDMQKRLEQQVASLEQAVLAAEQQIARHDEELDYKRRQDALDRNMLYAERLDRTAHVESVRSGTSERYGDLSERIGELEVAVGTLFEGNVFDRSPLAAPIKQIARDRAAKQAAAKGSGAPAGR